MKFRNHSSDNIIQKLKEFLLRKAQTVNILRWITQKYVPATTALEINSKNIELMDLLLREIGSELGEAIPEHEKLIKSIITKSDIVKGLKSINTITDLKKGARGLDTVPPQEVTVNLDGVPDPKGNVTFVYVPVDKIVALVFSNKTLKTSQNMDKHPGLWFSFILIYIMVGQGLS